jgi:hypothetical protein
MAAFDAVSGKKLWDKELPGGVDRMALSPDGETLYAPSFEGPHWNVVNAPTARVIAKIEPKSGATIRSTHPMESTPTWPD